MGQLEKILNTPTKLSEPQEAAVLSEAENVKIIAGAGAGKTETLTRRILYLLMVKKVEPSSIVAFTFTEKAAQSMKSRIYQRIQEIGSKDMLRHFGEMYVGTIHGFYFRILQEKFGYGDYGVMDENQEMAFVLRYGYNIGINSNKFKGIYSSKVTLFLDTLNIVYGEMIDRDILKDQDYDFFHSMEKYEGFLNEHHRLTFNYMSHLAIEELSKAPEILDYVKYLIVDEFQDINRAQFALIKMIGDNASVFVVGDPRQSIYQWRGSDERYFNEFSDHFPNAMTIPINQNRRSAKKIIKASNTIADNFETSSYDHMKEVRDEEGYVNTIFFSDMDSEAETIADKIKHAKEAGANYSDFGILFRSVNTSAQPIIDKFRKLRIPYMVGGKIGLFKRGEAQALGRLMVWLNEKGFWQSDKFNWKDRLIGPDLLKTAVEHWRNAVGFDLPENLEVQLQNWKDTVLNESYNDYKEILSELLIILGYKQFDQDDPYDATLMANIGRFSSMLNDFESANRYGGKDGKWKIKSELNSLTWYLNTYATKAYEEQPSDDISNVDAVSIMTIHQAKGLEWPTVFLPSMVSMRFPSSRAGRAKEWMIDSKFIRDPARLYGSIEDEKRLFYVAVTRSRDNLVLSRFTSLNGKKKGSSIFLNILNQEEKDGHDFVLPEHNSLDKTAEELSAYSTKELIDYRRCPFHYRLASQWRYSQGISPFMGYGETMHSCLQRAGDLIKNQDMGPLEAVEKAFMEKFFLPFATEKFSEKIGETLKEQMRAFAKNNVEDMYRIDEVETRIEFPLENATVTGRADVILNGEEALEVRDYKTSDKVFEDADSTLQVQLYAVGLSYLGKRINKGSVANISETQIKPVGVTYTDLEESKEIAKTLIDRIKNHDFKANPGSFCEKCEYNLICKWSRQDKP